MKYSLNTYQHPFDLYHDVEADKMTPKRVISVVLPKILKKSSIKSSNDRSLSETIREETRSERQQTMPNTSIGQVRSQFSKFNKV